MFKLSTKISAEIRNYYIFKLKVRLSLIIIKIGLNSTIKGNFCQNIRVKKRKQIRIKITMFKTRSNKHFYAFSSFFIKVV